jgi:succinylglutamic semialdehyde dehydrogenase
VLFTGSYEVGTRIKQDTLHQHWKLLALEMGGKNAAIILEDASLDVAIFETLIGAFLTAGQRCSATSRILVHESRFDEFVERFHQRAKAFRIGHPLDQPFMGPLIEEGAVDRYMKFLGIASREGFEVIMRGKVLEMPVRGNYVTPSICVQSKPSLEHTRKSTYQQTELFSPNVAILKIHDLDEAIEQANCTQYGLAASLFTQSKEAFDICIDQLQVGILNWNKATVGATSRLPFGGRRKSGNHFPTGVWATTYCTVPVASLEVAAPDERIAQQINQMPGLNWQG